MLYAYICPYKFRILVRLGNMGRKGARGAEAGQGTDGERRHPGPRTSTVCGEIAIGGTITDR
jgi:hypothetical protein